MEEHAAGEVEALEHGALEEQLGIEMVGRGIRCLLYCEVRRQFCLPLGHPSLKRSAAVIEIRVHTQELEEQCMGRRNHQHLGCSRAKRGKTSGKTIELT